MAIATKKCKVCGKEYEYCHTLRRIAGVFRWQDVACCIEHGSIYLARIQASRTEKPVEDKEPVKHAIETDISCFDDHAEYDDEVDWFEKDFNNEEK